MPATSKAQRQLFGIANAVQKGKLSPDEVSGDAAKIAKDVSSSDVKKFAKTKEKGLPQYAEQKLREFIKKTIKEILDEDDKKESFKVDVHGTLTYDGEWWIELHTENSTLAIGPSDAYKIPDELVQSMDLDNLDVSQYGQ